MLQKTSGGPEYSYQSVVNLVRGAHRMAGYRNLESVITMYVEKES